jgi:hypothetical protein
MTAVARYIIVLDRMDDDEGVGPDGHWPTTDKEGMDQVAAELQEAMTETGQPVGFFRVVARAEVEYEPDACIWTNDVSDEAAHHKALSMLNDTRNY